MTKKPLKILLIDDNADDRALVARELCREFPRARIEQVADRKAYERTLKSFDHDLVIIDNELGWESGLQILHAVKRLAPECPVVMVAGAGSEQMAVDAMKAGLSDYVLKSAKHIPRLTAAVKRALENSRQRQVLQEIQTHYRGLFEGVPVGLCRVTPAGKFIEANPALVRITGCPGLQTLFLHDVSHFIAPGDSQKDWRKLLRSGKDIFNAEIQGRKLDGAFMWLQVNAYAVRDGDNVRYYEAVVKDITEVKNYEAETRQNAERFRLVARAVSDVIWDWDIARGKLWWNENFEKTFGYRRQEIEPGLESWTARLHPEDKERVVASIHRVVDGGGNSWSDEYRFRRRDGSYADIFDRGYVIRDDQEKAVRMVGAMLDFTERKRAEEALRQSEKLLKTVLDTLPVGVWVTDAVGKILMGNPAGQQVWAGARLLSIEQYGEYKGWWADTGKRIEPEEWALARAVKYGETSLNEVVDIECFDGTRKTVLNSAVPIRDETGKIMGAIVVNQDITENRRAEKALRDSEAHLRAIIDTEPECVMLLDDNGKLLKMNDAGLAMIEADSAAEVIGRPVLHLIAPEYREPFHAFSESVIRGNKASFEFEVVGFKGTHRWLQSHAVPLKTDGSILLLSVTRDITERKRNEERLSFLAHYDSLTGLPNRTLFNDRLQQAMIEAQRHDRLVGVIFLDLDRFKNINDSLGHDVGDILLKGVAERLNGAVRKGDTVARLSGDEFTLVLADMGHVDDALRVAQKIIEVFEQPFHVLDRELHVTASLGITLYPFDDRDINGLLRNADVAMYRAKEAGRNTYQFYAAEMTSMAQEHLALENDLRHVLDRNELFLDYQPIVDCGKGNIIGVEALLRWRHSKRGLIMPNQFIPLAEETGLIVPIGEWVLRTACAQCREWHQSGHADLRLTVNLSPRQFQQPKLPEIIERILLETGLESGALDLEITEGILIQKSETTISTLRKLHQMKVGLAVDDFGTGYSSLSYLKRFPIDVLKIDQSFVRDIPADPDDAAIATAIISMAHNLGIRVIAEGVETKEQLLFMREHRCDALQGYYFSRPAAPENIAHMLRENKRLELRD